MMLKVKNDRAKQGLRYENLYTDFETEVRDVQVL